MEKLKQPHQILIVDDMPKNVQVLGQILAEQGFNIFIATSGFQALKAVEKKMPDLILLDISMPEMDGFEICKQIKEQDKYSEIPIIFLTARTETEDILKAFAVGGVDYITKPFNIPELLARVNQQLALKEKTEDLRKTNESNKALLRVLLHDLRNPIVAIDSINQIFSENQEVYIEMNDILQQATKNCMEILDSVKKMYTIQDQKYTVDLKDINLFESVQTSVIIFKNLLHEKEIEIDINIPKDYYINVDTNSFTHSVIDNLITNAIKFSYPNSKINITASQNENQIILSVRDFGIGIPVKILETIFDITKPTSRPGTKGEVGTGYGMPLVKKFIEMSGGSIEIKSVVKPEKDHGTEVLLYLNRSK
jgi:two-component system sensor histidine kinase/response regulator